MSYNMKALVGAGITMVVIVIVLTVSSIIVGDLQTDVGGQDYWQTISIVTEANTSGLVNSTLYTLERDSTNDCFEQLDTTSLLVWNTNGTFGSGNFTGYTNGSFVPVFSYNDLAYISGNNTPLYFNYSYYDECTHSFNITGEGGTSLFELSDWLPLVALVIASGVIVGIVVSSMGGAA